MSNKHKQSALRLDEPSMTFSKLIMRIKGCKLYFKINLLRLITFQKNNLTKHNMLKFNNSNPILASH